MEEISLEQLKNGSDTSNTVTATTDSTVTQKPEYKEVSIDQIAKNDAAQSAAAPVSSVSDNVLSGIDKLIDRKSGEKAQIMAEVSEEKINAEAGNTANTAKVSTDTAAAPVANPIASTEPTTNQSSIPTDDDFDEFLKDDGNKEKLSNEEMETMKTAIKQKIKPINNVIDIASFTISKQAVSLSRVFQNIVTKTHVADWVLPATGRILSMSELSGSEIEKLDPNNSGRNRLNTYTDIYTVLYSHVVDPNKPATLEAWLKTINFFDNDHLYFAAYKASFEGTNVIPYHCADGCKEIFMQDSDINTMVKYRDADVEKKMKALFESTPNTDAMNTYPTELHQISDNYVIGLREPSIYNVVFENSVLDKEFTEKFKDFLGMVAYIDEIYFIDRNNGSLIPIDLDPDPTDLAKTVKKKIVRYAKILNGLSSDQYYALNAKIKAINDRHNEISYVLPSVTCPKCNKVIAEEVRTPESLLFTRHQLEAIANT